MSLTSRLIITGAVGFAVFLISVVLAVRMAIGTIADNNVDTFLAAYADVLVPAIDLSAQPDVVSEVIQNIPRDWQVSVDDVPLQRSQRLKDWLPLRITGQEHRFAATVDDGRTVEVYQRDYPFADGTAVTVSFALDAALVDGYKRDQRRAVSEQLRPLLLLAALVVAAVLIAQMIAITRPLRRVSNDLDLLQRGAASRLSENAPLELAQLTRRVNGLLARNDTVLSRYRQLASNMAHAIKTPLSVLRLRAEDAETRESLDQINALVERSLARARLSGSAVSATSQIDVSALLGALQRSYEKLSSLKIDLDVSPGLSMLAEREDLIEAIANVIDNACRFARHRVSIRASEGTIMIDDDGPGIVPEARAAVLERGVQLDAVDGGGIGLSVSREILEAYGGRLSLGEARTGGLRVSIELPGLRAG